MAKKLNSVLGVDIGSQKIKVVEIRTQSKEPVVTALGMIDTPEGAVDHTGIYNAEAVGAALKQCLSQCGAATSHAIVSVAGQSSVLVRTLEVPRMSDAELKEHMQWEINRNIPFSESNVLSDYRALEDEDPNSPNMEVVMAISPQSAIDSIVIAIKKAGKQMAAIDVQPMALARSLKYSFDDVFQHQTVCIVDVGHKTTSINIYRAGNLLMPRQVPVGGEIITKAIADAMGIGIDEAEALKLQKSDVSYLNAAFAAPLDPMAGFMPPSGGMEPALTQEFQPYNPFADDTHSSPDPSMSTSGGYGAQPDAVENPFVTPSLEQPPYSPFGSESDTDAAPAPMYGEDVPVGEQAHYDAPEEAHHPIEPHPGVEYDPFAGTYPGGAQAHPQDPETERINNAISPVIEEFIAEIRRSLDYFRSRGGGVERVVLCGGASRLTGLVDLLSQQLATPCDSYDPLRRLNIGGKKIDPQFVDQHRPDFAVAVGNGLHIFFD